MTNKKAITGKGAFKPISLFVFVLRPFIILLLIVGCYSNTYAQPSDIHFRHISEGSPIANNYVFDIIKDKKGFVWVGTYTGLYRYDGYTFKPYSSSTLDGNSIPGGPVRALLIDHQGRLWISVAGKGIWVKDKKDKFQKAYPDSVHGLSLVISMIEDKEQNLWLGTDQNGKGVIKLSNIDNLNKIKGKIYNVADFSSLTIDHENNIWCVNVLGLHRFDSAKDSFVKHYDKKLGSGFNKCIFTDKNEMVWVCNMQGLFGFHPRQMVFNNIAEYLNISDKRYKSLEGFGPMLEDKKGGYWVGTTQGLINISANKFQLYKHQQSDPDNLSNNEIHKLYLDDDGILWVGTATGLDQVLTSSFTRYHTLQIKDNDVELNEVRTVNIDKEGSIWLGVQKNGLVKINKDQHIEHFKFDFDDYILHPNSINCFSKTRNGDIWVGGPTGIHKFDIKKNKFIETYCSKDWLSRTYIIWDICEDADGTLWLGTKNEGITNFNPVTKKMTYFEDKIPGYSVWCLHRDKYDNIWAGTDSGLFKMIKENGTINFKAYPNNIDARHKAPGQNIWRINESKNGKFWITTSDGGLLQFNPENGQFKTYSSKDGFPSDMTSSVEEDNDGTIWVSTVYGLCHFDPIHGKVISTYYKEDGLNNSRFSFKSSCTNGDSLMVFGDLHGFSTFNPSKIREKKSNFPIAITSCKVLSNSNWIEFNVDSTLLLNHDQNNISIEFASLNFLDLNHNQYAYQFSGADTTWINCGSQHQVSFGNLTPGDYTFRVKALSADKGKMPQMAMMHFIIRPPFWKTWWFISLMYIALFSILGYILYSVLKSKNIKRQKIQSELALLRTQLNPHFVFSSLSSLQQFITSHDEEAALEYLSNFARLMRNILEYSKNELVDLEQEINFIRLFTEMESVRINNKVRLIIEKDFSDTEAQPQIPPMIMQPLIENSLKHGMISRKTDGYIKIRFQKDGNQLIWTIEDNGIGRVAASANSSKIEGKHKSMSMSIIKDRLNLFAKSKKDGAAMSISDLYNDKGEATGTRIELRMPLIYKPKPL